MRFLGTDSEAGGIGDNTSLLTAYFVALDNNFNTIDDLYLRVKPADCIYNVTAEGLEINGINIVEHNKLADTPDVCMQKLIDFVKLHSDQGRDRLVPIGHNVAFDIRRYKLQILRRPAQIDKYVDHRCIDTCAVARFLQLTNKLPSKMSISLDELSRFFKIPKPEIHDAKTDTHVSISVLKEFIKLVNPTLKPEELAFILGIDPPKD